MDRVGLPHDDTPACGFRVIVPTRDSAGWIEALARSYDGLGVRPLFVVDGRSVDGTSAMLRGFGADAVEVLPEENFVEDIVWRIPSLTNARWVLRMDDDEMPSRSLLDWTRTHLHAFTLPTIAFPRRWAFHGADGSLSYADHKQLYYIHDHPDLLDPQIRLYRPDKVNYFRRIHTPGLSVDEGMHLAPPEAFICHFDWIARTFAERHAKLLRYEAALPGCGDGLLPFYLPELLDPADRCDKPLGAGEFDSLAAVFARYRMRFRTEAAVGQLPTASRAS